MSVADHRVRRVDGAVREGAGQPERQVESNRRQHAVGEVLRDGLDGGRGHLPGAEACRGPAHKVAPDQAARSVEITLAQRRLHPARRADEAAQRKHGGERERLDDDARAGRGARQHRHQTARHRGDRRHRDRESRSCHEQPRR
jgi:hypothetical protein